MSKTVYLAGEVRQADAVRLPVDVEKSAYVRYVPEDAAPSALPAWIREMCVQSFTPSADTNEALTFPLTGLSAAPDTIIIGSTLQTPTATRDFGGYVVTKNPFGFAKQSSAGWGGLGFIKLTSAGYSHGNISSPITNESASSVTVTTPTYSSTACYWRAGVTYIIIALRTRMPDV